MRKHLQALFAVVLALTMFMQVSVFAAESDFLDDDIIIINELDEELEEELEELGEAAAVVSARFEGLTRIVASMDAAPGDITKSDVVIDNIISAGSDTAPNYWKLAESEIKSVAVSGNTVVILLTDDALKGEGALRGKMAPNACVTIDGGSPVAIPRQGSTIASVSNIIAPASGLGGGNSMWPTLTSGNHRVNAGDNRANWVNELNQYSLVGMQTHLLFAMFDFPDARAEDNDGITGDPGVVKVNRWNRINGQPLRTAENYHEWLSTGSNTFLSEISFGNINPSITLIKNSRNATGVYRLMHSLYSTADYMPGGAVYEFDKAAGRDMSDLYAIYPWIATNPSGWVGYQFGRGGSTANWTGNTYGYSSQSALLRADLNTYLTDPANAGKPGTSTGPRFTGSYWGAVENAPGISYGASYGGAGTLVQNLNLGYSTLWYSFMGADSFNAFKWKHMTHEMAHQFGITDYYLEGGFPDRYLGTGDDNAGVGGFDHQGYITGHAPDIWAQMKWKFGWFRDDQVVLVSQPGTYQVELTPMNTEGGSKLIIIPGSQRGIMYAIEFRGGYTGADNTRWFENSTDPMDPYGHLSGGESLNWIIQKETRYGGENWPGILMYEFNANSSGTTYFHTRVIDLVPRSLDNAERYGDRSSSTLKKSLMGPASGVYEYYNSAHGITVSIDKATVDALWADNYLEFYPNYVAPPGIDPTQGYTYPGDQPVTVTIIKENLTTAGRTPVLSNAQFVDFNTIQVETSMDMRATANRFANDSAQWQYRINGGTWTTMRAIQVYSDYIRLFVNRTQTQGNLFTLDDIRGTGRTVEVRFNPSGSQAYNYLVSAPVRVNGPAWGAKWMTDIGTVTLSNVRFISATQFVCTADKDLGGFTSDGSMAAARQYLRVTRPDGTALANSSITAATFARRVELDPVTGDVNFVSGTLTVTLASGTFANLSATMGTTVEIFAPVSSYSRNVFPVLIPASNTAPGDTSVPYNRVPLGYPGEHTWYHNIEMNQTDGKSDPSLVASLTGGPEGVYFEELSDSFYLNIIGGTAAGIRTKFALDIKDKSGVSVNVNDFGLFVVNELTGEVKTLSNWLAGFTPAAGFSGYNGIDQFPMTTNMRLKLEFVPPLGSAGDYTYAVTLSSPTDPGVWATLAGSFVISPRATKISIGLPALTAMVKNTERDLNFTFTPANAAPETAVSIQWASSNNNVAYVKDGKIIAVGVGNCVLTCTVITVYGTTLSAVVTVRVS